MDLDKFRSLSFEQQEEILKEYAEIMKKTDDLSIEQPKTLPSSPSKIKRELESPETLCHGQSKKAKYIRYFCADIQTFKIEKNFAKELSSSTVLREVIVISDSDDGMYNLQYISDSRVRKRIDNYS